MPHLDPEVRRRYRQAYDSKRNNTYEFAAVDGEGGNVNGRHRYLLLRADTQVLETGKDLTTKECLRFLSELPAGKIYVGYFFTYDVTMILRDLPAMSLRRMLDRESRIKDKTHKIPTAIKYDRYLIDWLPGKEFKVAKRVRYGEKPRWVMISDVSSFFQCSFVAALERWDIGTPELRARIAASKANRARFGRISQRTRIYNAIECRQLENLMSTFRDVCGEIGPRPLRWQGPGNLASAWLKWKNVPTTRNVPLETMAFARDAYYGGRFEITAVGPIRRKVYQYDINSAYPAVIRQLPCLEHGTWTHSTTSRVPRSRIYVAYVEFSHPKDTFLGTLPIRNKFGNISYPMSGSGWYWSPELRAAKIAGCSYTIKESWSYSARCDCNNLQWVDEIYQLRRRVGKTKKGNALKLALNSIYGKFAQSIGQPRWANPIWAGLITATTRGQIIEACSQIEDKNVLMIATDGIFTDVPLNLPLSSKLGEWELKIHENGIFIIQPGLYMLGNMKPKTRGVPQVKIEEYARAIRKQWIDDPEIPVSIPLNRFLAARQALHFNKYSMSGTWYTEMRRISFDWRTKRDTDNGFWDESQFPNDRPAFRPGIKEGGVETIPYSKSIGLWDTVRYFEDDQPEEADVLRLVHDE